MNRHEEIRIMNRWMIKLADHFRKFSLGYPMDRLLVVFDIDGTILDMRHMILYVLKDFDEQLGTKYFQGLNFNNINFHEAHVSGLLERLSIPSSHRKTILALFEERLISATAFPESQRPFHGVLDVVRWFQRQPNTFVGLNTGRPESLRNNTLKTLNAWGRWHQVVFRDELLFMRSSNEIESIPEAKAAGIDYFKKCEYRTFAFVDNEPENLRAVGDADPEGEILLLHADTIFKSNLTIVPKRAVKGRIYDFRTLVSNRNRLKLWIDPDDYDTDFRRTA
jgi:phosphoglycolate phosphatase-like HAD superfamily hydrolase